MVTFAEGWNGVAVGNVFGAEVTKTNGADIFLSGCAWTCADAPHADKKIIKAARIE